MEISFFKTRSGGAATPRFNYYKQILSELGHKVSQENLDGDILVLWSPINVDLLSLAIKIKKMKKPLIYECYYSIIEAYLDEGKIKPKSKREKRSRFLEQSLFELADLILVDTKANQQYFSRIYND